MRPLEKRSNSQKQAKIQKYTEKMDTMQGAACEGGHACLIPSLAIRCILHDKNKKGHYEPAAFRYFSTVA